MQAPISFSPGPSKVFESLQQFMADAYKEGILSISHRGAEFNKLSEETLSLIKQRLGVPEGYVVSYATSATECWEIIAQSFTRNGSHHFYSGSFGEKWFSTAKNIKPDSEGQEFDINISADKLFGIISTLKQPELIALTHNETSNGTCLPDGFIAQVSAMHPEALIAVDTTSSLNGANLNIKDADIWYASVQKCFGLPAGLSIMICSPKAIERALQMNENKHYNSYTAIHKNIQIFQTPCTPNVLGIYLLNRVLKSLGSLKETAETLLSRQQEYLKIISQSPRLMAMVENAENQSLTVVTVKTDAETLATIKSAALAEGMQLGSGYGKWKPNTFRIANFPAHTDSDFNKLCEFLRKISL